MDDTDRMGSADLPNDATSKPKERPEVLARRQGDTIFIGEGGRSIGVTDAADLAREIRALASEGENEGKAVTHLIVQGPVALEGDASFLFSDACDLTTIDGLERLDTSAVRNMRGMFCSLPRLERVSGVWTLDTRQVEDMADMFQGCSSLKAIDIHDFDLSRTRSVAYMFEDCSSLEVANISFGHAPALESATSMFNWCKKLSTVAIGELDAPHLTDVSAMFSGCESLDEVDLSRVSAPNIRLANHMFQGCESLGEIVAPGLGGTLENVSAAFDGCRSLSKLTIPNLDVDPTSSKSADTMRDCEALATVHLSDSMVRELRIQWEASVGTICLHAESLGDVRAGMRKVSIPLASVFGEKHAELLVDEDRIHDNGDGTVDVELPQVTMADIVKGGHRQRRLQTARTLIVGNSLLGSHVDVRERAQAEEPPRTMIDADLGEGDEVRTFDEIPF